MLRLGVIGTNTISDAFVKAAQETGSYQLSAVYSRTLEKARAFAAKYSPDVQAFADLEEFLSAENIDVVYVASPNGSHFAQTKAAIEHKKHVIVEKPAFSNPMELQEVVRAAKEQQVYFFEAIRTLFNDGFRAIRAAVKGKTVSAAWFRFASYDYRMADVLAGGDPPSFSVKYSGGSLTDIGVYLLYPAIALFGKPSKSFYQAVKLPTGVDGNGIGILDYGNFQLGLEIGRNIQTYAPQSEIYLTDGTLTIDAFSAFERLTWYPHGKEAEELAFDKVGFDLKDEAAQFAKIISNHDETQFDELRHLATAVNQVMYEMRQAAGIYFTADVK